MNDKRVRGLQDVTGMQVRGNRLFSATEEEIVNGWTTDIYFVKTLDVLGRLNAEHTPVVAEVFASRAGICCGSVEVGRLLAHTASEVWALPEGEPFADREPLLRIKGEYAEFCIYETAILGMLASSSGWATAARECKDAAGEKRIISFGARHLHPAVAPVMERAALVGGCDAASCILGAKLAALEPVGTLPHACFLIAGDTVRVAEAYAAAMPPGSPIIVLVDTFKDEVEETLRVADHLGHRLNGVRLDTPAERGRVTPELVQEVRFYLNARGRIDVQIVVSGGLDPERVRRLAEAGADVFGVGSYISGARPIDMTMDIKEVQGLPVAKRGRIPGLTEAPRLKRIK